MIAPDDPRSQMTATPLRSDSSGWTPATGADSCRPRDCLPARRPRLAPARLLLALALGGGCEEPNEEAEPVCENFIDSARGCLEYRLAQGMDTQLWGCTFSCDYSGRCIDVPADPLAESWGEILRRACNDYQFQKENACEPELDEEDVLQLEVSCYRQYVDEAYAPPSCAGPAELEDARDVEAACDADP